MLISHVSYFTGNWNPIKSLHSLFQQNISSKTDLLLPMNMNTDRGHNLQQDSSKNEYARTEDIQ